MRDMNDRYLLRLAGTIMHQMPVVDNDTAKTWIDNPKVLGEYLEGLKDGPSPLDNIKTMRIDVKISRRSKVEMLMIAGGYDWYPEDLNTRNLQEHLTVRNDPNAHYREYPQTLILFNMGRHYDEDMAVVHRTRKRLGLKPIGFEHLAAIGEQHPQLQIELRYIVDPDARLRMNPGNVPSYICLHGTKDGRRTMHRFVNRFDDTIWFVGLLPY